MKNPTLQWHPAFYAGMQIELSDESANLIFENEHQLGTKPKEIDVLIIKKDSAIPIQKNIGRIFRTHNIIEYKSPTDYLSIDDFYHVYAYACFYKADTTHVNEISAEEITISFVCTNYPRKLIHHLKKTRKYEITTAEPGLYYIVGDFFPMQIICTSKLTDEDNFWLHNLSDHIHTKEQALKVMDKYEKHSNENLYKSIMDAIINANNTTFKEVGGMCEALRKLCEEIVEEQYKKLLDEKNATLKEKDAALEEKDAALEEKNAALEEKDAALEEKNAALKKKDAYILELEKRLEILNIQSSLS